MSSDKQSPGCIRVYVKGRPTRRELLRRLKAMPGIHIAKCGKPKGARKPMKIKSGEKTLAEIVREERR